MKTILLCSALFSGLLFGENYTTASEQAITSRVNEAKNHLEKSDGGKLLWESIEAHGGLDNWFANGLLKFRWAYHMTDMGGMVMDSTQTIDTWSSRAVHNVHGSETPLTIGWDGKKGWMHPADGKMKIPADFWALTPYYFVGVPHVLADPGTIHEKLPTQIEYQGEMFDQVKVSYEAGTGATPDDYYIVLIDPETKLVRGVRYIVTDQRITGGKPASDEKFLSYEGWTKMDGVLFPKKHLSHKMNGNEIGEQIRHALVSEAGFLGNTEVPFSAPEGE